MFVSDNSLYSATALRKRRTKRRYLSVFVGFIGFDSTKLWFLMVIFGFVDFVEMIGIVLRSIGFIGILIFLFWRDIDLKNTVLDQKCL